MTLNETIDHCMSELKELSPKIYHRSASDSIYIKFRNINLGVLRISDHPAKLPHRWNLRSDLSGWRYNNGCHYYGWNYIDKMIARIKTRLTGDER